MEMNAQEKDQKIAEQIRQQLGATSDVEQLVVKGELLQMHVTQGFYHRLASDRERGRKIVLMLMQRMKALTGSPDVAVWIYTKNEKVIEGKVKNWGGDNVMYLADV